MPRIVADKYELLRRLGKGGMAEVFLARQRGLDGFEKLVVVKQILPQLADDEGFVTMFLDEARTAADLRHPNVVNIFEVGEDAGTFFMVMEFLHGQDIRKIQKRSVRDSRDIPLAHSLQMVIDAAAGLHHAHTKTDLGGKALHIVHRDVSPQNIICTFDGATKIVDFGIAKAASQSAETQTGIVKGKYTYMSPEQAIGDDIDGRTDQYALGIVLWELLTMRRLFRRETDIATLTAITSGEVPEPNTYVDIPDELNRITVKSLAFKKEDRFDSCEDMALALEDFLAHQRMPHSPARLGGFLREMFAEELAKEAALGLGHFDGESISELFVEAEGPAPPVTAVGRKRGPTSRLPSSQDSSPGAPDDDDSKAETTAAEREGQKEPKVESRRGEPESTPATRVPRAPPAAPPPAARVPSSGTGSVGRQMAISEAERKATRRFLLAALGGGAVVLLLAGLLSLVARLPGTGTLIITSEPKGATVTIDGVPQKNQTPDRFEGIELGRAHEVVLSLDGYHDEELTVTLPENDDEQRIQLVKLRKRH